MQLVHRSEGDVLVVEVLEARLATSAAKDFGERLSELLETRLLATMPAWIRELREWMPLVDFPDGSILTLMPERVVIR